MTGRIKTKTYTERALSSATIPSFCFVPRGLRTGKGAVSIQISEQEIAENHARIADADPIGWVIAVMNGQPIPNFRAEKGELLLEYAFPDMEARQRAAEWLGTRVTFKTPSAYKRAPMSKQGVHSQDYDAMIERTTNEGVC